MQLKILVSALFSIALFGRVLPPFKWKGLVILTIGCAFVNLDQVRVSPYTAESTKHQILDLQTNFVVTRARTKHPNTRHQTLNTEH
jgi:hypothetical protein